MGILGIQLDLGGIWRTTIFFGLVLCLISFLIRNLRRLGWVISLAWLYGLVRSLFLFEYPSAPFDGLNHAFMGTAAQFFAELLIVPLGILSIREWKLESLKPLFGFITLCEVIAIWVHGFGLMKATSFDLALISLYLPFAPIWLGLCILATVVTHHGSTAMLIIAAQYLGVAWKKRQLVYLIPLIFGFALARYHQVGPDFLNSSERIHHWIQFMTLWWSRPWDEIVFGIGPGSFPWISMMLNDFKLPFFLQMHCDWLQITFECGVLGLIAAGSVYLSLLKRSTKNMKHLSAMLGIGVFAMTYHPLRFFPSSFLITWIFITVIEGDRK